MAAKKRIFIAIPIAESVKNSIAKELGKIREKLSETPIDIRFLKPENWHLTVTFLGYQDDDTVSRSVEAVEDVIKNVSGFEIAFEKIVYGPIKSTPRMIWAVGSLESSRKIGELKKKIEEALIDQGVRFQRENRPYTMHLTIARFMSISKKELPIIEAKFDLLMEVDRVEVMQSTLKRSGAEYSVLSEFSLK